MKTGEYKLSIPMMNGVITEKYREKFLKQLKDSHADRVFIADGRTYLLSPEQYREHLDALRENIAYFKANGLEVGMWFSPMGHGGALNHAAEPEYGNFTRVTGFNGGTCDDSFCIDDPEYAALLCKFIQDIAKCGAQLIQLDDDLRFSSRSYGLGCTCEHHMKRFNEKVGGSYTREGLYEKIFCGGPSELRTAWLDAQGESMLDFCRKARAALDEVNPEIRLGFCAAPGSWDTDGTDALEMTMAFAGKTKPFLRGIGAPYWSNHSANPNRLADVIGYQRLQTKWTHDRYPEIEFYSEGDVYPRPRYRVPSWLVECYDSALRADGTTNGILKYMSDYSHYPNYERGYFDRHQRNLPVLDAIEKAFAGKTTRGVYIYEVQKKLRGAEFDEKTPPTAAYLVDQLYPASLRMMNRVGAACTFEENGDAVCVFGESARYIPLELLKNGCILDGAAAQILAKRGVDLGFEEMTEIPVPANEQFPDYEAFDAECVRPETGGTFYAPKLKDGACIMSEFIGANGKTPAAWCYENPDGVRSFVLAFKADTVNMTSPLIMSYARQEQVHAGIAFAQKKPLPVSLKAEPWVFFITADSDTERAVGFWNLSEDVLLTPELALDGEYSSVTFIRGEGSVDGNRVKLSADVPAHDFVIFTLKK